MDGWWPAVDDEHRQETGERGRPRQPQPSAQPAARAGQQEQRAEGDQQEEAGHGRPVRGAAVLLVVGRPVGRPGVVAVARGVDRVGGVPAVGGPVEAEGVHAEQAAREDGHQAGPEQPERDTPAHVPERTGRRDPGQDGRMHPPVPSVAIDAVPDPVPADLTVLDVREDDEWQAGHVEGAVHLPLSELGQRADEVPDGQLLVVCKVGGRSARVVAWLTSQGRDAVNLDGGMLDWEAAGRPMVSETDAAPYVS